MRRNIQWSGGVWRSVGNWTINLALVLVALVMVAPLYWMVVTALTAPQQAFSTPPSWFPPSITLQNFVGVFQQIPFGEQALNSLKVASVVTLGSLATSVPAAYALSRLRFRGRSVIFLLLLAALMVPAQVTVIPTFVLMRNLGLIDTQWSLVIPGLINVLAIFLLRQSFLTLPPELEDAAKLDGASHAQILFRIVIPLSRPILIALGIYIFQLYWNDFFWPNVFLRSPEKMTLPLGLVSLQGLFGTTPATVVFAAITIIVVPLLVIFGVLQRRITESFAMTRIR
jgi:ABC-type glycerol-3-phosphate transport system permease component